MPPCSTRTIWLFVVGVIVTNALLLFKYYSMLQEVEQNHKHPLDNNNNNKVLVKPPQLQFTTTTTAAAIARHQPEQHQEELPVPTTTTTPSPFAAYSGPYNKETYRFNLPEMSPYSKSPWGRLLSSLDVTPNIFNEHTESFLDVADVIISKIIPLKFWRLDPLVENAVHPNQKQLHEQTSKFHGLLRKVKHQATNMKFRWPWHMAGMYDKNEQSWIDSQKEREEVFQKVKNVMLNDEEMKKKIEKFSHDDVAHNNNSDDESKKFDLLLDNVFAHNSAEVDFSDNIAKIIEDELLNNEKLPVYSRKVLASRLRARQIFKNTGCNVIRIPFTNPTEDEKCIAYLNNIENWKSLKPLPVRYDARTIKFQIEFNEPDLHSVLKVPQRLFPYEAFAEIGAYHADRVLGVRRIPPTAYACIPKTMIRKMLEKDGKTVETDEETLKDSGVKTYGEMVEKEILAFSEKSVYNVDDRGDCVGVSVQPLMADVHHLLDSVLVLPYKTHDKSWHKYFNYSRKLKRETKFGPFGERYDEKDFPIRFLDSPYVGTVLHMAELVAFDFVVGNNDRSPNKNFFVSGSCVDDAMVCSEDETSFFNIKENNNLLVHDDHHHGDGDKKIPIATTTTATVAKKKTSVVDTASSSSGDEKKSIEQQSRVDWQHDFSALRRPGPPSFIHIDQGMAFYQTPTDNAITKSLKVLDKSGFCVFRRRFVNRLLDLFGVEPETLSSGEKESIQSMIQRAAIDPDVKAKDGKSGFTQLMMSNIPGKALHSAVLTKTTFVHCERRMRKVLLQISRCLSEHSIEEVIAP